MTAQLSSARRLAPGEPSKCLGFKAMPSRLAPKRKASRSGRGRTAMSLKPSRRGVLVGMGATAADAVLPVQANTRDDPMAYRAAGELVEALAKGRVSSRELVDSAIARVEALDPKINAVVVRDFDRARAAAPTADAALAKGERRLLLRLTMTLKEQFGVAPSDNAR